MDITSQQPIFTGCSSAVSIHHLVFHSQPCQSCQRPPFRLDVGCQAGCDDHAGTGVVKRRLPVRCRSKRHCINLQHASKHAHKHWETKPSFRLGYEGKPTYLVGQGREGRCACRWSAATIVAKAAAHLRPCGLAARPSLTGTAPGAGA